MLQQKQFMKQYTEEAERIYANRNGEELLGNWEVPSYSMGD